MTAARDRTPVSIITGCLGSGKTTLLKRVLAQAEFADAAVIIHEFGEIALDHLLVTRDEGTRVAGRGSKCWMTRTAAMAAKKGKAKAGTMAGPHYEPGFRPD